MSQARAGNDPSTIDYDLIRTTEQLHALKGEWTDLLRRSRIASPFLTWEWMAEWWLSYGDHDPRRELAIVTARRGGELVAVLPGYVRRDSPGGLRTFMFLGTEYESTDYLELIERRQPVEALLGPMLNVALTRGEGIDVLHLTNVLASHRFLDDVKEFARMHHASHDVEVHRTCPFIEVSGSWDEYFESLGPKMRKNLRRYERQLTESGATFECIEDRAQVRPAVQRLFELHALRFAAKQETTGFKADQRLPFHTAVAERFFDAGILRLFVCRVDGRTVASLYCFEHAGELFYFQSGIDPEWDRFSVGTVVIGKAVQYAFDRSLTRFDFMRGTEAYKFRWTDKVRDIVAVRVGVTLKGRTSLFLRRRVRGAKGFAKQVLRRGTA